MISQQRKRNVLPLVCPKCHKVTPGNTLSENGVICQGEACKKEMLFTCPRCKKYTRGNRLEQNGINCLGICKLRSSNPALLTCGQCKKFTPGNVLGQQGVICQGDCKSVIEKSYQMGNITATGNGGGNIIAQGNNNSIRIGSDSTSDSDSTTESDSDTDSSDDSETETKTTKSERKNQNFDERVPGVSHTVYKMGDISNLGSGSVVSMGNDTKITVKTNTPEHRGTIISMGDRAKIKSTVQTTDKKKAKETEEISNITKDMKRMKLGDNNGRRQLDPEKSLPRSDRPKFQR